MIAFKFAFGLALGSTLAFPVLGPFSIIAGFWLGMKFAQSGGNRHRQADYLTHHARRDDLCQSILQRRGFDARSDNAATWTPYCEQVLRNNRAGNFIGYTEFNRSQARQDAARRNF